ncbi:MAG: hypothetical protein ACK4S2_07020 [Gemmobacter sp.]|uniref:hypothetical protein n=1 Tax=Gemmobacter sp. TaxID=1898957 RepID=UPI00391DC10F
MSRPRVSRPPRAAIVAALDLHGSTVAAAEALGLHESSLRRVMREMQILSPTARGLPRVSRPAGAGAGLHSKPRKDAPKPPALPVGRDTAFIDDRAASLASTGGRYADLCAWADRNGLSFRQAQQRWHQLRLPVSKGAAHDGA